MALIIKHIDFTPDWGGRELILPADGVDPYGECYGGDLAVFDFDLAGTPNQISLGQTIANLRTGGQPATGGANQTGQTYSFTGVTAANGLPFTSATSGELLLLNSNTDILAMGDTPSVFFGCWIKENADPLPTGGVRSILGYASGVGSGRQWLFGQFSGNRHMSIGSLVWEKALLSGMHFYSMYLKKTSSTDFEVQFFEDNTKLGVRTGTYAANINNPHTVTPGLVPTCGVMPSYSASWLGVVPRFRVRKVDPDYFDPAAFIAAEVAANAPRWAA